MLSHETGMEKYRIEHDWWEAKHRCLIRASEKNGVDAVAVEALKAEMAAQANLKHKKPRMRLLIRQDISVRAIMGALAGHGETLAVVKIERGTGRRIVD